jgi:phage tail sheath protein FI
MHIGNVWLRIAEIGLSDEKDQGITVTEIAAMNRPIAVTSDTTAAFVGRALRGPLNTPVLINSFSAFQRRFGGNWHRSGLGSAVKLFFEHGGTTIFIVRVANNARGAMLALPAAGGVLVLHALEPGSTENIRAAIDFDGIDDSDEEHFNLVIQRVAPDSRLVQDQEIFSRITCDDDSRNAVDKALMNSKMARAQKPLPPGRPVVTMNGGAGFEAGYMELAQRGTDGSALSDYDLIGSESRGTGIFALSQIEHFDFLYMPPPALGEDLGPIATLAAEQYCRSRGAMLVMDPLSSWDTVDKAVDGVRNSGYTSSHIVSYYPRFLQRDQEDDLTRVAGAAITGLFCKLDRSHGPWEDLDQLGYGISRKLKPVLQISANDAHRLVRAGLNVIAGKSAGRSTVCGSVTLGGGSQMDRKFSSLTVRRLCLLITNAIDRATQWAVFEQNGAQIAERILGQVDGYMSHLANSGAFEGNRFVVQCETGLVGELGDPDRGVTILLAFRPAGTDEDIALTLHQTVSGCRIAVTAFAPVVEEVA